MLFARVAVGATASDGVGLLARFTWEIGGAVAFGVLVGALFALYLRYVGREVALVVIAVCALLSQVGSTQQFEPLLAAVAAGLVIENLSLAQGDALKTAVQGAALPVLVIFFVAVGTSLRLDVLAESGVIVIALSALRLLLIKLGVAIGVRSSGIDRSVGEYIWTGLVSQAGITLGFAALVASEFMDWGPRIQALLVAFIAIHELLGPLLFRYGLSRSGDLAAPPRRPLVVVSNREPYLHRQDERGRIVATAATGGVAVALDALMRERNGVWVAHGAGPADRQVVDETDRVLVPPESPSYELRRLWLEEPTFSAYYNGFANEGLWPLCHLVDVRPQFRTEDWTAYRDINTRFAAAVSEEVGFSNTPVFIQDYHLALVAPALRARLPHARTALFWHIPWPYPDRFRICPWASEILRGLLANDLLAFQLERDRRNFLLAAEEELDVEVEHELSRVRFGDRNTTVVSVPIGVDYDRIQAIAAAPALAAEQTRLARLFQPLGRDHRHRRRSARLHEGDPRTPRRARRAALPPAGAQGKADVRPDRRAVAVGDRELRRDRGRDRSAHLRHQRAPPGARRRAGRALPHQAADDHEPRRALPPRRLLHRQLAPRRDEPGRQGVRVRARR